MESKVSDLGPCEKLVEVTLPPERIKRAVDESFNELRHQIVLPGFRPGKVPRNILERRFGEMVRQEVLQDLVKESIEKAIDESALEPVSVPTLTNNEDTPKLELKETESLVFSFSVEVKPDFELPKYRGREVVRHIDPVSDEQVEEVLGRLALARAEWLPKENEAWEPGDMVVGPAKLLHEDRVLVDLPTVELIAESPSIGEIPLDDPSEALAGRRLDDVIDIRAKVPPGFKEAADLVGKEVRGTFRIEGVKALVTPPLDDELAKTLGGTDLSTLRSDIRRDLEKEHAAIADHRIVRDILDQLLGETDIPLAHGPTDRMVRKRVRDIAVELQLGQGMEQPEAFAKAQGEEQKIRTSVERDTRSWLLLEKIAKREKIFCLEDDADQEFQRLARHYQTKPSTLREYYEREGLMPQLRSDVLERKVCEFLREHARITDEDAGLPAIEESAADQEI